jgi:hypothetical protein
LLEAARADVPSAATRTKMWSRVSGAVGGAASVAAATTAAAATGAAGATSGAGGTGGALAGGGAGVGVGAAKMLAIGVLLGGTVTVGMAATLLHIGSTPNVAPKATAQVAPVAVVASPLATSAAAAGARPGDESAAHAALGSSDPAPAPSHALGPVSANEGMTAPSVAAPAQAAHAARAKAARRMESSNSLSLEASLITEARAALVNGDALTALRKARVARSLPARQLVPEELTVEAQALRALGRDGEANAVDQTLRAQYPESALAR